MTAKVELHVHLEGTVRAGTLREIARRNGLAAAPDPTGPAFGSLANFFVAWNAVTACLMTADDYRRITVDYAGEAAAHGAVYVEGIFTPDEARADDLAAIFEGYCDGVAEAYERHGLIVRLTPEQYRGSDPAFGERVARMAVRFRDRGVVGFGLAGAEGRYPDEPYLRAMRVAADGGLGLVPHAGEAAGPRSVRSALDLGARRIRHGVRAVEEPALLAELAEAGVVLDVCPTSNVRLGVVPSFAEHPLPALVAAGVRCSISTDDPAFFDTDLTTEYAVAAGLGLTPADAFAAGVDGALCDEATRTRLANLRPATERA